MKLIDCKIDKALLIETSEDFTEKKVLGKSPSTFRRYRFCEVVKITTAPAILRDGTIDYAIYILKRQEVGNE